MKNLLMIVLAVVTISVSAQERKRDGQKGAMKEHMELHQDMTPQEMASLQTKKMTLQLDLTDKQQKEVESILLEEAKMRKAKMAERKAKMGKTDGVKPSKEERLKMVNERLDQQIEMKKKMKAILNAKQYEKFEAMQSNKQNMRGKKSQMRKNKQ